MELELAARGPEPLRVCAFDEHGWMMYTDDEEGLARLVERLGEFHSCAPKPMEAVAQAAKDTNAVANVGAMVPNARPDVSEQQDTVDLTDDDPSPETAAAAEVVRHLLSGPSGPSRALGALVLTHDTPRQVARRRRHLSRDETIVF